MGSRYDGNIPNDMEELILHPSVFAVFPNDNINYWQRLHTKQLPKFGYELANHPCIENYLAPEAKTEQELWVPIIAK
ncbi:hypothetical protein NST28_31100 [Paenibacillus sp. FSL R10-2791]|uniref:GyrI-like domain-containing protein n=1 Tax=unclassified Paenibacillus TaxID=185978 RepID=UPI0030FBAD88